VSTTGLGISYLSAHGSSDLQLSSPNAATFGPVPRWVLAGI
jgi:hypothetical protein